MTDFATPKTLNADLSVQYGNDGNLIVEFFTEPRHFEGLSKRLGRPIHEDRVMTRIVTPGNTKTMWVHETKGIRYTGGVTAILEALDAGQDIDLANIPEVGIEIADVDDPTGRNVVERPEPERFPKEWAAFQKKAKPKVTGWAIEDWGVITRSQAQTLNAMNVYTVEQLAALSDANIDNIMGGRKFRDLARGAIEKANAGATLAKTLDENEQLKARLSALEARLGASTSAAPDGDKSPSKPVRGRGKARKAA
jgi:hypothetical protein